MMYKKVNDWAKWVAVDSCGEKREYSNKPRMSEVHNRIWCVNGGKYSLVSTGNDATNWQNSLIEIDAQEYKHEFKNDWAVAFIVTSEGVGVELSAAPKRDDENSSGWSGGYYGDYTMFYVDHNYQGDWKDSLQLREEPKRESTDWNGEGLPPVGAVCEVKVNKDALCFLKCEVLYLSDEWAVMEIDDIGEVAYKIAKLNFRPIKTEREKVISSVLAKLNYNKNPSYELEAPLFEYIENVIVQAYDNDMLKLPEGE